MSKTNIFTVVSFLRGASFSWNIYEPGGPCDTSTGQPLVSCIHLMHLERHGLAISDVLHRLVSELHVFKLTHDVTALGDSLYSSLLEVFSKAMRFNENDDEDSESVFHLLRFLSNTEPLFREEGWRDKIYDPRKYQISHEIFAMLTAAAASLPDCRWDRGCFVDKFALALWRFANAGASLDEGFVHNLYEKLKQYLPSTAQWRTPWQCPTIYYSGLQSRPSWSLKDLPEGSAVRRLFLALRDHADEIALDLKNGVLSEEGRASIRDPAWTGLHQNGRWMAFSLYRSEGFYGRRLALRQLDPVHCILTPHTCDMLRQIRAPPGMEGRLPSLQGSQEVVDFLRADPGTRVTFHAAQTNARLTVQLCLSGCNDADSYMRVANEYLFWKYGEPIVFDDSFLHSVEISPSLKEPRWVLSLQVMHPSIDTPESFSNFFARSESDPSDDRESALIPAMDDSDDSAILDAVFFCNELHAAVLLYTEMWGPRWDGPPAFLGEVLPVKQRPFDEGQGIKLPPLAHRSRLIVRNVSDGSDIRSWRVDARGGGMRRFKISESGGEYLSIIAFE